MIYTILTVFRILKYLNFKTIYFNFKYFKVNEAICFPVFVSGNTYLRKVKGRIQFPKEKLAPGMIRIGFGDVGIFDQKKSRTIWEVNGNVIFNGTAKIGHGAKIVVGKSGILIFGERFTISAESSIICFDEIEFGNDCLLSWDILVMDTDFHQIYSLSSNNQINKSKRILIGAKCWIGCRSLILKGAILPENTIVAANSYIGKSDTVSLISNCIVGGNPTRVLKDNVFWK
jgi:acetyltransferase-like isoleucine patch superfamily enzyme